MQNYTESLALNAEINSGNIILVKSGNNAWQGNNIELLMSVSKEESDSRIKSVLKNSGKNAVNIKWIEIINIEVPQTELRFLRFGLNMPGDPVRFGKLDKYGVIPAPLPLDSRGYSETADKYIIDNNSLFAFATADRKSVTVIGGETFKISEGQILLECDKTSGKMRLVYKMILDGLELLPGKEKALDGILILQGEKLNRLLEKWADKTAAQTTPLIPETISTGWSDWQYYRNDKTQEDVLASTEVIAELKAAGYPLEFVQVDGGFCMHLSEWTQPRPSFSDGIKSLSEKINSKGLKFGLWLAPYIQNRETKVVKEHPEWLLLDENGNTVELPKSNVGQSCLIDYSLDEPLEWLRSLVRMFVDEWNVKWIKLDGPNYKLYRRGKLRNNSMTMTEMLIRSFEVIRETAGPDILVEGEGMMGLALGKVDLHRVQTDNFTRWNTNNNSEIPFAPQVYGKELIMSFLHNRWWHNHRENIILRDYPSPLCDERANDCKAVEPLFTEAEFRVQIVAAVLGSGGILLTDPMKELRRTPYRMKYIAKVIPVWPHAAEIVDVFPDARYPSSYMLRINTGYENYAILGVINWDDEIKDFTYNLKDILENKEYIAFSFFDESPLKIINNELTVRGVTARSSKLIAIREKMVHPQLASTNMHFIQGAVELDDMSWSEQAGKLSVTVKHFEQSDEKLFFAAPPKWKIKKIETNAKRYSIDDFDPEHPSIRFEGNGSKLTVFDIFWSKK